METRKKESTAQRQEVQSKDKLLEATWRLLQQKHWETWNYIITETPTARRNSKKQTKEKSTPTQDALDKDKSPEWEWKMSDCGKIRMTSTERMGELLWENAEWSARERESERRGNCWEERSEALKKFSWWPQDFKNLWTSELERQMKEERDEKNNKTGLEREPEEGVWANGGEGGREDGKVLKAGERRERQEGEEIQRWRRKKSLMKTSPRVLVSETIEETQVEAKRTRSRSRRRVGGDQWKVLEEVWLKTAETETTSRQGAGGKRNRSVMC